MGNQNSELKKMNKTASKMKKRVKKFSKKVTKKAKEKFGPKLDSHGFSPEQIQNQFEEHKLAGNLNFKSGYYDQAILEYK